MRRLLGCVLLTVLLAGCAGAPPEETPAVPAETLLLPTPTPGGDATGQDLAALNDPPDGRAAAESVLSTPTLQASAPTAAPVAAARFITVTVGAGDTLLGFAIEYGVPMAAIQLQNDLGSSTIVRLGQDLVIPPTSAWEGASPFWIVHQVSEGETLSEIGQAHGLTVGQLQGANGLADADLLSIGQALVLPLTDFAVARAVEPTARPPTAEAVAAAPTQTAAASETQAPEVAPTQAAAAAPVLPPPADVSAWPHETVRIMNEVRATHGLPPLVYNETLAQAAQIQANDCADRGWCSHTGSDGSDIKERILRVGYQPASWAECWALRPTPQGAIDIWMDEVPPNDPHRRTLLTTWLTEIGIGVAKGKWGYYFIAEFGKPLR